MPYLIISMSVVINAHSGGDAHMPTSRAGCKSDLRTTSDVLLFCFAQNTCQIVKKGRPQGLLPYYAI